MSSKEKITQAIENPSFAFKNLKTRIDNQLEDLVRLYVNKSLSTIINQKEMRVVGLRRTGNHALITWIKEQITGKVLHLNNLIINENPYRYKYQYLRDYYPQYKQAIANYQKEAKGDFSLKECLIYSYEDYSLEQVFSTNFENKHDIYLGKSEKRYDLLIIRDPFNLIASRYKKDYMDVKAPNKNCSDLWLEYAKEYLGETNYLKHNKLCINYNQWVDDINYRQSLAENLGIEFTDKGINIVHGCGGGSSFEGREMDGQAEQMKVHDRWRHFIDDPYYRQFFQNPEIRDYSERIFGYIPETEALFSKA